MEQDQHAGELVPKSNSSPMREGGPWIKYPGLGIVGPGILRGAHYGFSGDPQWDSASVACSGNAAIDTLSDYLPSLS